jgi:hypothetical protein
MEKGKEYAMVATGTSIPVEKVVTPQNSRAVFSSKSSLIRKSKLEPDMLSNSAFSGLCTVRFNDDMRLFFQHDTKDKYYVYIVGRSRPDTKYIGLMPHSVAESHKDVVIDMMCRFNARLRDVKGGMVAIHNDTIYIFGTSGRYHKSDPESVEKAFRTLVPEAEKMKIEILLSINDLPKIEGL